ncbi:MAG: glycine cleavage system protein R, partial [Candidatus Competibacteraceae bacterium]|nr:glycine cleavage system protein R [Candidatus Competibacteraceae bacterium]
MKNHLVITVLGENRPSLVRELSRVVLECDCGIEDSRMTMLGSEFAATLMVQGNWSSLAKLEVQLKRLEQTLGLAICSKRTEE